MKRNFYPLLELQIADLSNQLMVTTLKQTIKFCLYVSIHRVKDFIFNLLYILTFRNAVLCFWLTVLIVDGLSKMLNL